MHSLLGTARPIARAKNVQSLLYNIALAIALLVQPVIVHSQPPPPTAIVPAPKPAPTPTPAPAAAKDVVPEKTFELGIGYLWNLQKNGKDSSYYFVKYTGQTLAEKGTAFADPSLPGPNLPAVATSGGDAHNLALRLENGTAQFNGGILDAIVRKPINAPFLKNFRGALGVNATQDFKQIIWSGGLESPAIHPLRLLRLDPRKRIINWLFVGAFDEKTSVSGSDGTSGAGTSQDAGVAVYRAFIGQGFHPVTSKAEQTRVETAQKERASGEKTIRDASEIGGKFDLDKLKKSGEALVIKNRLLPKETTNAERVILFYGAPGGEFNGGNPNAILPKSVEEWEKAAFEGLSALGEPVKDLASIQAWFESEGWYQFTKLTSTSLNKRYTNLLSANAKFYLDAEHGDNYWILLRFQRGTERAAPDVYKNYFSASLGFSF